MKQMLAADGRVMIQKEWRTLSVDDMNAQKVRVDNDLQRMIGLEVTDWTVAD